MQNRDENDASARRHKPNADRPPSPHEAQLPDSREDIAAAVADEFARNIVETLHEPLLVLNSDLTVRMVNPAFYKHFHVSPDQTIGRKLYDLGNGQWDIPALRELLEDVLPANHVFNDYKVSHKFQKNGRREMLISGRRLNHSPLILLGIRDVTENAKSERMSRYLAAIVESSEDAIIGKTLDGTITSWNWGAEQIYGYTAEEMIGRSISILAPAYRPDEITGILEQLRLGKTIDHIETVRVCKDGTHRDISLTVSPIEDSEGRVIGASAIARDITARKLAERKLRESEQRMHLVTDALPVLISYVDKNHRYQFNNAAYENWFGLNRADIQGMHIRDVVGVAAYEQIRHHLEKALSGDVAEFETELNYKGTEPRHVHALYMPHKDESGNVLGLYALVSDNTKRKLAERALTKSKEQYRLLFESIDEGFCVIEVLFEGDTPVDYRFLEVNPGFVKATGLGNAVGRRMRELAPDHEQHWFDVYGKVALTGEPIRFEHRADHIPKGGWFDLYAFRVGKPEERRVAVLFTNITKRKRTEAAIRESEERYRLLVEGAEEYAMFMLDVQGRIVMWSHGASRIFGYNEDEVLNQPVSIIFTEDDRKAGAPEHEIEISIEKGSANDERWHLRKDGSRFWASGVMTALYDGELRGFAKVLRDNTTNKRHEEQMRTVMAELNHRVKNTLAVVQSIAHQTLRSTPEPSAFRKSFEQRLRSLAKAHNLLTRSDWRGATITEIVKSEIIPRLGAPDQCRFDGPSIRLTPDTTLSMHMVIHELATNACKYGALSSDNGQVVISWVTLSEDVETIVFDWREHCDHAVEPPKDEGYGSGLIRDIVEHELRGTLESEFLPDGLHCRMTIRLSEPSSQISVDSVSNSRTDSSGAEILVIEDAFVIARSLCEELRSAGYRVLGPAGTLAKAMSMVESKLPDAAVLDVNLGGTKVYPLARRLREMQVPFVFITSYDEPDLPEDLRDVLILSKPVSSEALLRFLHEKL